MKAVILTQYGSPDMLKLQEIAKPTPKPNQICVRVRANSLNFGDLLARNFKAVTPRTFSMPGLLWLPTALAFGLRKPNITILGNEFAGEVESVGSAVTRYKVGDAVFGYTGPRMGANAEYVCIAENGMVAPKPANLSDQEAATLPYGALTALSLLRKAGVKPGYNVLINGASGGIGSYAVQIAKIMGATVTGVCGTPRMDFVRSLGADKVIDYTRADFTQTQSGERYDVIMDVIRKSTFGACKRVLAPKGIYLLVSFKMANVLQGLWTARRGGQRVMCTLSSETPADMQTIREWAESGALRTAIDRAFPLAQAADAHRYMESGQRTGPVVITV